jgi:hypothetical protein
MLTVWPSEPDDALGTLGHTVRIRQAMAQAAPLRVKEDGSAVSPVWLAWNPMLIDAPGAMVLLWLALRAVTWPLAGEYVAFQPLAMLWPAGRLNTSDQPLMVEVPVLVTVMAAVRPVFHELTVYPTRQAAGSVGGLVVGGLLTDGSSVGGVVDWNWVKNFQVAAGSHVEPLRSVGTGVWPPSKVCHSIGYPVAQPV